MLEEYNFLNDNMGMMLIVAEVLTIGILWYLGRK